MPCITCTREFTSDRTPLAVMGYCMMCRADVNVTCAECGTPCMGAPDGQLRCRPCRTAGYFKAWLYADTTSGRLWRHNTTGFPPDF